MKKVFYSLLFSTIVVLGSSFSGMPNFGKITLCCSFSNHMPDDGASNHTFIIVKNTSNFTNMGFCGTNIAPFETKTFSIIKKDNVLGMYCNYDAVYYSNSTSSSRSGICCLSYTFSDDQLFHDISWYCTNIDGSRTANSTVFFKNLSNLYFNTNYTAITPYNLGNQMVVMNPTTIQFGNQIEFPTATSYMKIW